MSNINLIWLHGGRITPTFPAITAEITLVITVAITPVTTAEITVATELETLPVR